MVEVEIQLRYDIVKSLFTMVDGNWNKEGFEKEIRNVVERYYPDTTVEIVWDGDVMWDEEDALWLAAFVSEDGEEGIATESRMLQDILLMVLGNRIRGWNPMKGLR